MLQRILSKYRLDRNPFLGVVLVKPLESKNMTAHSTIKVESISHEVQTDIKDEILDIEPPTKIKRKSNLNHHTDEILHEIENESQLIDEHILEEPTLLMSILLILRNPVTSYMLCETVYYKPFMAGEV